MATAIMAIFDGLRNYSISFSDSNPRDGLFWLENESGEGMNIKEKEMFDFLDSYFKENF